MRPRFWFLLFTVLFVAVKALPQAEARGPAFPGKKDSAHFWRSASQLGLAEAIPILFDRYITNEDYARISLKTVGNNLSPGSWKWDYDGFQTNQIGHPYHGSVFYNAFRSNGYSFWQSVPASFVGSYIWETVAENQPPSPNDFINTGFGGMVLGEMTHRMADKLTNNGSRGVKRQVNEVLALLINPMNGLNRILNGKWGRPVYNLSQRDTTQLRFEFDLGLRKHNVNDQDVFRDGHFGVYGRIKLLYGTPFGDLKTPFSNISVTIEGGQDDSSKVNIVSVYGSLAGWRIPSAKFTHILALSANYDYINNEAFFYSAQSVKLNEFSTFPLTHGIVIHTSAGIGPILLAAVPDAYLYHARDYDYGPGIAFDGAARIELSDKFGYGISYRGGWMKTVNGNESGYFVHAITNEANLRMSKDLSVSAESGYFFLHGSYRHYTQVDKVYPYIRLSIQYHARW